MTIAKSESIQDRALKLAVLVIMDRFTKLPSGSKSKVIGIVQMLADLNNTGYSTTEREAELFSEILEALCQPQAAPPSSQEPP